LTAVRTFSDNPAITPTTMKTLPILFVLIFLAAPMVAHATITTFTDRATFLAALGAASSTTETFDTAQAFALGSNFYHGINFQVTGTSVGGNNISGGILNGDEFTSSSIDYLFPMPIFALGADFTGARTSSGFNWIINGITTQIFSAAPGTGFFGVISTDPFSMVDVSGGAAPNEIYSLDNFTFASVPEPSALTFLTFGLAILGALAFSRGKRAIR
jgi:hypothetical protein